MSKIVYSPDKPNDCRYCHFWKNNKKGCCLREENCYYLISVTELLARDEFAKGAYMLGAEDRETMLR